MNRLELQDEYVLLTKFSRRTTENGEGVIAESLDLNGCVTMGDTFNEAWDNAKDAFALWILNADKLGKKIPEIDNSRLFEFQPSEDGSVIYPIKINLAEYRRKLSNRAIKKSVTIPSWLNELAETNDINYSHVLQRALKAELGVGEEAMMHY